MLRCPTPAASEEDQGDQEVLLAEQEVKGGC